MTSIAAHSDPQPVKQFSVFSENKVGRLNDLVTLFHQESVQIVALCAIDNTDSAIVRFVANYPDEARRVLKENHFPFNEIEVVAVEMDSADQISSITSSLTAAEINVHYTYPFLIRPGHRCGMLLRLEDNELATEVMNVQGLKVLDQSDIAR